MLEGRWFGTMCLSEPQAGSSLADITTRAEPQDDGSYRLTGNKMWISAGDHELTENIVHLVLAKIPGGPPGVKGISLFIVPKFLVDDDGSLGERNDVVLAGLNHKMGYRGTTNTLLNFGEGVHRPGGRAGAVGYLVGEQHRGLAYMFHMMNEARIGVGAGRDRARLHRLPARAGVRAHPHRRAARPAAKDPVRAAGADHRARRRPPDAAGREVLRRGRAGARAVLRPAGRRGADRRDAEDERAPRAPAARHAHPDREGWPSQWCLVANDLAIQVHGGYGYTRDYPVEQFYRDNRLNPIHEGTHGIQALDLLGRKVRACRAAPGCALLARDDRRDDGAGGRHRVGAASPPTSTPRSPGSAR